ncbi:hypothetical protein BU24DRAFT_33115 [Aaosphaeria arxii CBS 175.79]|uniref:Uncharacterized protein n=1 Tax=Aaosphaeria arxii CBS 175.79 TaxID=1450172 RepID=A0A6A5Y9P0_9PLEO|nr:uncharacterized protein BU24DRAFT_33115 [Aaosphaeria arxii CBS 175.79]KAF2021943.1 hypothetical protein BU24DRAFT_33115 [Aaosphaeria arxii CBS 175.79]
MFASVRSSSMTRLLALLFALLLVFNVCTALPATDNDPPIEEKQLATRGNAPSTFKADKKVKMGNTLFFAAEAGEKHGSAGFDSCLGLLIVGDGGAIIGHYSATGSDINNDWGERPNSVAAAVPRLFRENRAKLTPHMEIYIYAQLDEKKRVKFQTLVDDMQRHIAGATGGHRAVVKTYSIKTGREPIGGNFVVEYKSKGKGFKVSFAK